MGLDEQGQEPIVTDDQDNEKQKTFQQEIEDQENAVIGMGSGKEDAFDQVAEDQESDVIDYGGGKRKRGKGCANRGLTLGCLVGLLSCGACVALFVGILGALLWPAFVSCRDFTNALYAQDYATAYDLLTENYQNQLGGLAGFQQQFKDDGYYLAEGWELTSIPNINNISVENNEGEYIRQVQLTDGRTASLHIRLVKEGEEWRIDEYYFDSVSIP